MFKFYLNGIEVDDPVNWDDFSETIERDDSIKGLLPKYEIKLQFTGNGYAYLFSQLAAGGFCRLVELEVKSKTNGGYKTELNGYIFLTECRFNLNKCLVECEVEDNNYGARIYRNKSIKVYIDGTLSKNGETIDATDSYNIDLFTPSSGTYSGADRKVFPIKDAFRFLIDFMTDGLVGFESDYLGSDTLEYLTVTTGEIIRTASAGALAPFISFEDLFKEVNKKYPLAFTIIKGSDGRPTMKIEDEAYFFGETSSIRLENIDDLRQSFDNEVLYSSVKFGSPTVTFDASIHHFGYIRFLSFKEEQYFLQGTCNIDKTLDLYGEFICDSNIIEELFATATTNDSYDENVFFIQTYDSGGSGIQATQYDNPTTGGSPYYYNGTLTNDQVSARYNYNGSLALYLSGAIVGFRASKTSQQNYGAFTFAPSVVCTGTPDTRYTQATGIFVEFQDDTTVPNFDTGAHYNTTLSRYTATIAGEYVFETAISYSTFPLGTDNFNMYHKTFVEFRRFNSSNVLMQSSQTQEPINPAGFYSGASNYNITHTAAFTLDAGDYVVVAFWFYYCPVNCTLSSSIIMKLEAGINNTWFRTIASPTEGGVYQDIDTAPYRASKYEFEQPLDSDTYETMKEDLSKSIIFNHKPLTNKTGWLRRSTRIFATGATEWELISNITNSN